jgi:hypothetical protein
LKRLTHTLFFLVVLLANTIGYANTNNVVRYDSSVVKTILPKIAQETSVFNQVDLDFAKEKENNDVDLVARFWNWLSDLLFGKADYDSKVKAQNIFVLVLALVGIGLIIWALTHTQFTSFLRGNSKHTAFNFSDVEEDITGIDFNERINKAFLEHDYRLAIRWLYLKQLFLLNEKNAIAYQPFKTNIDYTNELSKTPYLKAFTNISKIYDYVWYGKYSITEKDYQSFEQQFKIVEQAVNV